jgi:hypothetical protein
MLLIINKCFNSNIVTCMLILLILLSEIHKLIHSVWNKEEFPVQWKESIIVPVHKKGDKTVCHNYLAINFIQNFIKYSPLKDRSVFR